MLSEVFSGIISIYESYRGNGKIIALVLVAFLFLYLIRKDFDFNPIALLLSPLFEIGLAAAKVFGYVPQYVAGKTEEEQDHTASAKQPSGKFNIKKLLSLVFIVFLMIFAVTMSGENVFSKKHVSKADNMMHIPQDYIEVMDFILEADDNPSVIAMPDYSMYHRIYSSRFDMLYELRSGDDFRYLSENARNAFLELSSSTPDMKKLADTAIAADCDYIILKKDHYWSEFSLERFGFVNAKSFDNWDVYVRREAADE